ncbi:procollagen-proline 3-dioxygenase [Sarracenia purpurea var. burkii]
MYWFPPEQASTYESGFDICFARIHALGYDLYSPQDKRCFSALDSSDDLSETLMEPLQLVREDELFEEEFVNVLHVLQVVQFYSWKASELQMTEHGRKIKVVPLSQSQREEVNNLKRAALKDEQLAETLFGITTGDNCNRHSFNWDHFSAAVTEWEAYCEKASKQLLLSLPYWRTHQSIFS